MTHARTNLPATSPVYAAIAAHRAAYDAFQVAPEGKASVHASDAYDDASMAVVAVACTNAPEALALFRHLAWWVLDEADFAAGHQPAYDIAMARAKDLSLYLSTSTGPAPIPQAAPSGRLGAYFPRRSVPVIDLRSRVSVDAPETDAATPEIMFRNLDASQETLEGWGKLLSVARTRYLVAASAACLEPDAESEAAAETASASPAAPAEDTFALAPTGLADACRWALRHRAWVDRSLEATDWSDEKFDAETGKTNAVITRAINEPSTHLAEIVAKAALALDDFERFQVTPHRDIDDGTRIVHTVLHEVAAFQVEADAAPAPGIDFGPDAHIAKLAAEFCEAYAANNKADRAHMAGDMPEAEWTPYYRRTVALMNRLEATAPKTLLGMALKCLAPIGLAGWNTPADGNTDGMDPWERVGAQLLEATMAGALTPFAAPDPHPADLLAAAGISLEALPVPELCAIYDAADTLSAVASALTCQPRQMTKGSFNGAGLLTESIAFALHAALEAAAKELRSRVLTDAYEQERRAATLARLTIDNSDPVQTAAFARELLTMVEP